MSVCCVCSFSELSVVKAYLTLLHSERPKLYGVLAILSAIGLTKRLCDVCYTCTTLFLNCMLCIGCASFVSPTNDEGWRYNDNTWHQMIAWRDKTVAYISIDGVWEGLILLYMQNLTC